MRRIDQVNLYNLVDQLVYPTTKHPQTPSSFAQLIGSRDAGPPDYMVSHFWGHSFRRFVRSLRLHELASEDVSRHPP